MCVAFCVLSKAVLTQSKDHHESVSDSDRLHLCSCSLDDVTINSNINICYKNGQGIKARKETCRTAVSFDYK